ncbi:MAG: thioredoxin family protein [Deltaproteobacteria bacterium]|nr:thioredoxin family protein [Deltaproteobacteria bacterium]
MKNRFNLLQIVLLSLLFIPFSTPAKSTEIPVKNSVTLLDLGAHSCIPCKMMAPIIDKLQKEYKGKAAIIFIDVWENPAQGKKYGIRAIPTQIIYDKTGEEVIRHVGFLRARLDKLLALQERVAENYV